MHLPIHPVLHPESLCLVPPLHQFLQNVSVLPFNFIAQSLHLLQVRFIDFDIDYYLQSLLNLLQRLLCLLPSIFLFV
jgi:hypothetical protein